MVISHFPNQSAKNQSSGLDGVPIWSTASHSGASLWRYTIYHSLVFCLPMDCVYIYTPVIKSFSLIALV
jgi:hypothetical protein